VIPSGLSRLLEGRGDALGPFGAHPVYVRETTSTNDVAAELARQGAPEGTWVLADVQTAGRGRRGRPWISPPGAGLYVSVLFRPAVTGRRDTSDPATTLLTLMAGLATAEGVESATGLHASMKWPNDLVVTTPRRAPGTAGIPPARDTPPGRWRKLGGILAEGSGVGSRLQAIVVGIGVNLRRVEGAPAVDGMATSIEQEIGYPVERDVVLVEILATLRARRRMLLEGGGDDVLEAWRKRAPASRGHAVRWTVNGVSRTGVTRGIDASGALLVESADGLERVFSADVHWEWHDGP
jgi:BirA family biotin operon repressor/biotin-[acetyl-CoA-carboxylase] ligase